MKQTMKGFIAGFLACAMLSVTIVYAAGGEIREIFYGVKVEIDGVPQSFAEDMTPFIMDGRTFLPLRAIGEALGKPVDWDGAAQTVYVGKKPGGMPFTSAVSPYENSDGYMPDYVTMSGNKYLNALYFRTGGGYTLYNLNGQYARLSGYMGHIDGSDMKSGTYNFYGDGNLLDSYTMGAEDLPRYFSVNLSGVLQLKIEFKSSGYYTYYALADAVIE